MNGKFGTTYMIESRTRQCYRPDMQHTLKLCQDSSDCPDSSLASLPPSGRSLEKKNLQELIKITFIGK